MWFSPVRSGAITVVDVVEDDLSGEQSQDLIAFHLAGMNENVPDDAAFLGLSDAPK